jgi:hypothetical protein
MSAWTTTAIVGLVTALGLYALVRLRMYFGPIAADRFGKWGRRSVWILLITAMVVLAEFDLIWLRGWLEQTHASGTSWHYEAVYAVLILVVGLALVCGRILRRRASERKPPDAERDDHTSC